MEKNLVRPLVGRCVISKNEGWERFKATDEYAWRCVCGENFKSPSVHHADCPSCGRVLALSSISDGVHSVLTVDEHEKNGVWKAVLVRPVGSNKEDLGASVICHFDVMENDKNGNLCIEVSTTHYIIGVNSHTFLSRRIVNRRIVFSLKGKTVLLFESDDKGNKKPMKNITNSLAGQHDGHMPLLKADHARKVVAQINEWMQKNWPNKALVYTPDEEILTPGYIRFSKILEKTHTVWFMNTRSVGVGQFDEVSEILSTNGFSLPKREIMHVKATELYSTKAERVVSLKTNLAALMPMKAIRKVLAKRAAANDISINDIVTLLWAADALSDKILLYRKPGSERWERAGVWALKSINERHPDAELAKVEMDSSTAVSILMQCIDDRDKVRSLSSIAVGQYLRIIESVRVRGLFPEKVAGWAFAAIRRCNFKDLELLNDAIFMINRLHCPYGVHKDQFDAIKHNAARQHQVDIKFSTSIDDLHRRATFTVEKAMSKLDELDRKQFEDFKFTDKELKLSSDAALAGHKFELLHPSDFRAVGKDMEHCVGGYAHAGLEHELIIVMLRDSNGSNKVCIEIRESCKEDKLHIVQAKMHQNSTVAHVREYNECINEWANRKGLLIDTADVRVIR